MEREGKLNVLLDTVFTPCIYEKMHCVGTERGLAGVGENSGAGAAYAWPQPFCLPTGSELFLNVYYYYICLQFMEWKRLQLSYLPWQSERLFLELVYRPSV